MTNQRKNIKPILVMVDDDAEDVYLIERAFCAEHEELVFNSVSSGDELFDYLNHSGQYSELSDQEVPSLILLDINIPRENGFDILQKIKADPQHKHLPVVMLTTSNSESDVQKAYALGANSYLCKSIDASQMKAVAAQFIDYWFRLARVPGGL